MSKSSPGVRRVVSILNFFADHPGQAFTLTDLVRALKLSRATCHGLLTGLVEAGYLYRANDKSYMLGPAVVALGEVAKAHFSPLQAAQPEMRALADAFDVTCTASFRENGDVVIRERSASVSHLGYAVPRGTRLPLLPELAGSFFVGAADADIADWLDELEPPATSETRALLAESIAFVRTHGFSLAVRNLAVQQSMFSTNWLHGRGSSAAEAPILPLFAIDPAARYPLVFLTAPVRDGDETAFTLSLQGFAGDYSGEQVMRIGERLCAACARIAGFIAPGGRPRR